MHGDVFTGICVIVVCAAGLAWLASRTRQPIILAYFLCGVLIGPQLLGLVTDLVLLENVSRIGVTLLLFLAGLVLHPDRLIRFLKCAAIVTIGSCLITWIGVFVFLRLWGFGAFESHEAALALMFSSTILVVKLLPTTTLHQQRITLVPSSRLDEPAASV